MKKSALLIGLSLLSSKVLANEFNTQVDLDYLTLDNYNVLSLEGTYYFNNVSSVGTAWAEAAFMGRNDSVSLAYTDYDGSANGLSLGGDYYNKNIFVGLDVVYFDIDGGGSDTSLMGELGYFFSQNWLVSVSSSEDDFSDSLALKSKYIMALSDGGFVNFEAAYLNFDNDVTAAADYYWTAKSSVGLNLSSQEGYNFGIRAQHFFTPAIAARLEFISLDDDAVSVGVSGRF